MFAKDIKMLIFHISFKYFLKIKLFCLFILKTLEVRSTKKDHYKRVTFPCNEKDYMKKLLYFQVCF